MSSRSLVYVSYDRFPAPKGAATHIRAFVEALAREYRPLDLVTVAAAEASEVPALADHHDDHRGGDQAANDVACHLPSGVLHTPLPARGADVIERVRGFRAHLLAWWGTRRPAVAHVRSIFEGYPLAREKARYCEQLVFEVNGLPSIELKYHYPAVADDRELLQKLVAQEQCCLAAADLIVTVSEVNAAYLRNRGVDNRRMVVIPNGVDLDCFEYCPPRQGASLQLGDERSLLYAGTWSAWQGVQTAIEALALYRRDRPATLTIVGDGRPRQARALREFAAALGVESHVRLVPGVGQRALARFHHAADTVLAPLLANDRNLTQGCCPLKVLEAMASGTPLVASNLPVVASLARHEIEALLVAPGSAKAIKDALLRLDESPGLASQLSRAARQRVEAEFGWQRAQSQLLEAYRRMFASEPGAKG